MCARSRTCRRRTRIDLLDEGETLLVQPWAYAKVKKVLANYTIVGGDGKLRHKLTALPGRTPDLDEHWRRLPIQFGKSLLLQDEFGLTRWDPASGKLLDQWPLGFSELEMSANGKRLVASRGQRLYVCDGDLDALRNDSDFWGPPGQVEFLADGRLLVKGHSGWQPGGRLTVWDPLKKTVLSTQFTPIQFGRSLSVMDTWFKRYVRFDEQGIDVIDQTTGQTLSHISEAKDAKKKNTGHVHVPMLARMARASSRGSRTRTRRVSRIRWYDSQTGRELGMLDIPFREVYPQGSGWGTSNHWAPVSWYTPDGSVFGYTRLDSKLVLVNAKTGKVQQEIGFAKPTTWEAARKKQNDSPWRYRSAGFGRFYVGLYYEYRAKPEGVIWDRDGHLLRHYNLEPWLYNVFSPDGRIVAGPPCLAAGHAVGHRRGGARDRRGPDDAPE